MQVLLLYGGESAEREVSLRSGERVCAALRSRGHAVECVDFCARLADDAFFARCRAADAVFLALHGGAGEDGRLQAVLEARGIYHYTGSGAQASALAMQKSRAKAVVARAGVPVAKGISLPGEIPDEIAFPVIVKPEAGGSSVGLAMLSSREELLGFHADVPYLCEELLPGREFSVGVLGDRALPPVEIRPHGTLYDYAHKYTPGATEELCPAPIGDAQRAQLQGLALAAFYALGMADVGRIDFKEDAAGNVRFLEANTLPGMTDTSLLPLAARAVGIGFPALCEEVLQMAAKRRKKICT